MAKEKKESPFLSKLKRHVNEADNLVEENKLMRFGFILIGVGLFYLGYQIETKVGESQNHLIPCGATEGYNIGFDTAGETYYNKMAIHISDLYLDLTASNAKEKLAMLLTYFRTDKHNTYSEKFDKKSKNLSRFKNITYRAEKRTDKPISVVDDREMNIPVLLTKYVGGNKEPAKEVTLTVYFEINSGRFEITDIKEFTYE